MFEIKAWISDYHDELFVMSIEDFEREWCNNVSGYVEVIIGEHALGWFPTHSLKPGQVCEEWVNWWLTLFLECAHNISKTNYFSFPVPESNCTWLEFELVENKIIFNRARYESCRLKRLPLIENFAKFIHDEQTGAERGLPITEKFTGFTYVEPTGIEIGYRDFLQEIKRATTKFFKELEAINPALMKSKMAVDMLFLFGCCWGDYSPT